MKTIYFAGGCFWGMEKLFASLNGVIVTKVGYANGDTKIKPTYELVKTNLTGYKETIKIDYNEEKISLVSLLYIFFDVIDPTLKDQQGNDIGTQYQTGIYYIDEESKKTIEDYVNLIKKNYKKFFVEVMELENFYLAEEYHQHYLDKNPHGYCHISLQKIASYQDELVNPRNYSRPEDKILKDNLSDLAYNVTQKAETEMPYTSIYSMNNKEGIYVDITTGEPLFSSKDKYISSCGWPAFTKPIDNHVVNYYTDNSYNMTRTEVKSRVGNAHLGHFFTNDGESPNGNRYCINGAALRFIKKDDLEKEGYGYLLELFSQR